MSTAGLWTSGSPHQLLRTESYNFGIVNVLLGETKSLSASSIVRQHYSNNVSKQYRRKVELRGWLDKRPLLTQASVISSSPTITIVYVLIELCI